MRRVPTVDDQVTLRDLDVMRPLYFLPADPFADEVLIPAFRVARRVDCMVGFYSYNPPRMYEALKDAGKLGQITVVAFDEDPITLGAVAEGSFAGTVVQNPYEWGTTSAHLIADYLKGDKSKIPADGVIIIPGVTLTKDNVVQFQEDFQKKLAGG